MKPLTIHLIAGARPNFMKIAPLYHALHNEPWALPQIVHTGQHYDHAMSGQFFQDLQLPSPAFSLGAGSGTHARQTAQIMTAYEDVCLAAPPDAVIVVGDVNSTLACSLVAAKLHYPLIHLEAGLRSFDRSMPEEINRIVADQLADLLWTHSPDADENLAKEGIAAAKIERIGNIMIDALEMLRPSIADTAALTKFGLTPNKYLLVTLHRPSNVDDLSSLSALLAGLNRVAAEIPILFPVHPRTRKQLETAGVKQLQKGLLCCDPLPYGSFLQLMAHAMAVLTDSGGVQEETTYLNIPCLTLRQNTERPITITAGTNELTTVDRMAEDVLAIASGKRKAGGIPPLWDGKTAGRAVESLRRFVAGEAETLR